MDATKQWFDGFLQTRGKERPNGQMLFRYRTSEAEYQQLKGLLTARFAALSGAAWRFDARTECALFVLYASEWWRREYAGGPWRWHDIFQSLTAAPYQVDVADRSVGVERGLYVWGLRLTEYGRKYLGAIVANGGLPLQMLARGDGVLSRLLLSAAGKAQRWGWEMVQLIGYFESHAGDMVKHLREPEIYRLLAEMVTTVMELRREYQLAGLGNPVELLDQKEPRWRERFPVLIEDSSIELLLIGLVREVAQQAKMETSYPVVVTRFLVPLPDTTESYQLRMEVQIPSGISVEALATAIGIAPSQVPPLFALEMAGIPPTSLGQGRLLLGTEDSTALLTGKPRRFLGQAACQEQMLMLRGMGSPIQAYAAVPGGEALDEAQPWCFAPHSETLTLVGIGSCKVASDSAYVLVLDDFVCSPRAESSFDLLGWVEDLPQPRWLYQVRGVVDILADGESYSIRTNTSHAEEEVFLWKGSRFTGQPASLPVFKGVPRLYRQDAEGLLYPVSEKNIEWVQPVPKGAPIAHIQQHRGPVDAWLLSEGQRQRRFRMVLIAPTAEISYHSGSNENEAAIELQGWGVEALHTAVALSPECCVTQTSAKLLMRAQQQPPACIPVTAQWVSGWPQLQLELPFPARSGRFSRSDGRVLPDGATLALQHIYEVRVQVFDQNPNAPKRYKLQMQLLGDSEDGSVQEHHATVEVNIPIAERQHIGELRFFEIESTLRDLFAQNTHLDACIRITLLAGVVAVRSLTLTRYDLELEQQQQSVAVPAARFIEMSSQQLEGLQLRALPLLELGVTPFCVEPLRSEEGALVGRWDMAQLPAGHSPWLVYPVQHSSLQVRPLRWQATALDTLGTLQTLGDNLCPLAHAMAFPIEESRSKALAKVILLMAEDFSHPSWVLLIQQYQQLKYLPLNTLDYWRVLATHPAACLAVVFQLSGEKVQELMERMRDELGVMWELTSARCLRTALKKFWSLLQMQLGGLSENLLVDLVKNTFTKMGQISGSLALQIDRLLYQELGVSGQSFARMVVEYRKAPQAMLQALWQGEDCLLQRLLLRHHAQQETWPDCKMVRKLVAQIESHPDAKLVQFFRSLGTQLVWSPTAPSGAASLGPKQDVANTPLLLGILLQITDATTWLQSNGHMAALRQIKAFDPVWFDVGLQTGAWLALKAREQVKSTAHA